MSEKRKKTEIDPDLEDFESEESAELEQEPALDFVSREALEAQLLLAEKKAEEHIEKALRALAELDNIRRRAERDVANAHRYGVEKLVKELLPVIDSLEQALLSAQQAEQQDIAQGIELTIQLLLGALGKFEVIQLHPEGMPFNPQEHEAMSMQISDQVAPNMVLVVFQKGYKLSDRIIRPARVIVSKGAA